jgi:lipopolysaccharide transport system ATP-binding protein
MTSHVTSTPSRQDTASSAFDGGSRAPLHGDGTVISVKQLSKSYQIGRRRLHADAGLRHILEDAVRAPLKWIRGERKPKLNTEFWALKDVSCNIRRGEVVGIIGRNGAGKSTLLKILSRITEPTKGRIEIEGRVASLLEVGTGFHQELTGRENIFLNGAILGMTRAEIKRKFDEIVAFAEVEEFLDTPVKRYSSGMYVRLAFAVAAHLEPEILVIDEVLAVGDAQFQKKCLGKMSEVSRGGRTVLFVSHNMAAVSTLCDRVIVLNQGKIVFDGPTDEGVRIYALDSQAVAQSRVDLANRTVGRFGEKRYACLQTLELLNSDGMPSTTLQMGEKAVFRLVIDVLRPSDNFEIGIVIGNFQGVSVHCLVSGWEGLHSIPEKGLHSVEVELPSINIFPGDYQAHVWIAINGQYYDDAVEEALRFSVEEGRVNAHPTYFSRYSRNSQVYIFSRWTVSKLGSRVLLQHSLGKNGV